MRIEVEGNNTCNLCLAKKLCILKAGKHTLNKRTELLSKCRHENKFYVTNLKPPGLKITFDVTPVRDL